MELYKFHIFNRSFCAIYHRDTVSCCDFGIGGRCINSPYSASSHQCNTAQISVNLLCLWIENISAVAFYIRCTTCHANAQMVLRNNFHSKMMLQHVYKRICAYGGHKSTLNLCTRIIGMVENAELRMSSFTMQVKRAILFLIEINAPIYQFLYPSRSIFYYLFYGRRITQPITGHHRVMDMFLKIIHH